MPVRLVVLEQMPAVRDGLRAFLDAVEGIWIVGEAETGKSALAQVAALNPDVLLLDCGLADVAADALAEQARRVSPTLRMLAYFAGPDPLLIRKMLAAAASGILLKTDDRDRHLEAIRTVAAGGIWLSPQVSGEIMDRIQHDLEILSELTEREKELLRLVALGWENEAIARQLHLSRQTVKNYIGVLYQKLGIHSRVQAALRAVSLGLVSFDDLQKQ